MSDTHPSRAGISLLEVLISIGILAVGLTSVLSFIPAGHSMAKSSFVTDQAAFVAANALADIATQGYLRPDSLTNVISPVIIDPIGAAGMAWPTLNPATLRQAGVFCTAGSASPERAAQAAVYGTRARDDVAFNVPDTDAIDVTNRFIDGSRASNENFSWVAMLVKPSGGTFAAGDEVTVTVVVFHNRDPTQALPSLGPASNSQLGDVMWPTGQGPLIAGRKNSDVVRTNGVCFASQSPPAFRQIAIAIINGDDSGAFIELVGTQPPAGTPLFAVPDAVAVVEKTVTIEASSPYSE
jgi:hypothetical protein